MKDVMKRVQKWLAAGVVAVSCAGAWGQTAPQTLLRQGELRDSVAGPLRMLTDPTLGDFDRRTAAATLLDEDNKDADRAVLAAIGPDAPEHVWRTMVKAIALHPREPDDDWWPPLMTRYMLAIAEPDISLLAGALGRFDDNDLIRRIRDTAEDPVEPTAARLRMIHLWGYYRDKNTVQHLLDLTDTEQQPPIRDAAYEALIHLTGLDQFNQDAAAWQQWWDQARRLGDEQWLSHLLSNLARREAGMQLRMTEGEQRLLESQRALYKTTQPADRPAVLAYMLRDPLPPIRQLGLDLCLQRLLDDQPFDESLRVVLRERLVDQSPALRGRAALLLRDLQDEPAARIAAERLANNEEHVVEVVRSYLLLITRLPQAAVVEPALALLEDPSLRPEAAGALAAAATQGLLDQDQLDEAVKLARRGLPERGLPSPQVVTLLGKVGFDDDFEQIGRWVDADTRAVKQAAAMAWAESDRSLKLLANRAGDPVIRPIVITAAERRGIDPATLRALALHRPEQPDTLEAWRRALVAMAGRVATEHVLWTVAELDAQGESLATLERLLTAAIQADGGENGQLSPQRIELLLTRAETRLRAANPSPALADFQTLSSSVSRMSLEQVDRHRRGRISALLAAGDYDQAFSEAQLLLGPPGSATSPSDDRVIDQFIDAARQLSQQGHAEEARGVLGQLRRLLGTSIKPEIAQRITLLEAELRSAAAPASQPVTTAPTAPNQ